MNGPNTSPFLKGRLLQTPARVRVISLVKVFLTNKQLFITPYCVDLIKKILLTEIYFAKTMAGIATICFCQFSP